jgi:hypothetical protein
MVLEPEQQNQIYERIRDAIAAASAITNFSPNSPERAITDDGFSAEMRERQHEALAVQLSAYIDYAGKEITEQDLDDLGVDPERVDLDLLNSFIESSDLDALAKRYSTIRDPGTFATGTVTFQTSADEVRIPNGTVVGTQPDADGEYLAFFTTTEVVSPQGNTSVDVDVEAAERGTDYNVGAGTITFLPQSVPGVGGDPPVNNAQATTGGEDEETDEELRERAKEALLGTSGGGTLQGVENGLIAAFAGLDNENVQIVEYTDQAPVTFDYVVDGGPTDDALRDKMDVLRPVSIEGTLVRPTQVTLDITADVTGADVDTVAVEEDLRNYVGNLGLGDTYVIDKVIQTIMNADAGIEGIDTLTTTAVDEAHTYQAGTSVYTLERAPIVAGSVANVEDASGDQYVKGTDYQEVDDSGDGTPDAIDWSIGGVTPDDGETFTVDYDVDHDVTFGTQEKPIIGDATVTEV